MSVGIKLVIVVIGIFIYLSIDDYLYKRKLKKDRLQWKDNYITKDGITYCEQEYEPQNPPIGCYWIPEDGVKVCNKCASEFQF